MRDQDQYQVNQFSTDIDRLLEHQGCIEEWSFPAEYKELLDVAVRLAKLDFNATSPIRRRLRQELMACYHERQGRRRMHTWVRLRSRWRSAAAGLVGALLCLALLVFFPSARTLAQEAWQTVLHTVELVRAMPRLSGEGPTTLTTKVESPTEATFLVDFPIRAPSFLPHDYEFRFGLVSHLPGQSVSFDYGIPPGRIVTLQNGRAVSARTFQGLRILQIKDKSLEEWPIGQATIQEAILGDHPALWLTGLPIVQSQVRTTVRITKEDEKVEQTVLSQQQDPPLVLAHTQVTALMWEEDDLLLIVIDLDGRFSLKEMTRIAKGLVAISTPPSETRPIPTSHPEMTHQTIANIEEMVATASFSPYVLDPLPQGWHLERITAFSPSNRLLERWYIVHYQHSQGAHVRLTEGLVVPLQLWPNYIEGSGALRQVADNSLEVWTSEMHQGVEESMAKENARLNKLSIHNEIQAMFLRTPDGFSLELVAVDLSWDETLVLVEHLALAPGADPALNSQLMKGCSSCP
jgi:hypothetical protein